MPPVLDHPVTDSAQDTELQLLGASVERLNISSDGKRFKCWFMCPGIVDYEDVGGGQELIRKPAIDESLNSLMGAPLTMGHVPTTMTRDELEKIAQGHVDEVGFDSQKGWHYCAGTVEGDKARSAIREGHGVSVGTRISPRDFGGPGFWLNNRYDREILKLKFHHMAIVPPDQKPRFEDAEIRLNSTHRNPMLTWIRKLVGADGATTETKSTVPRTAIVQLGDGKTITVGELLDAERQNACHALMPDDHVECDGVRYHCGTLIDSFRKAQEMQNAGRHIARPNADDEMEKEKMRLETERKNAEETERLEREAKERANAENEAAEKEKAATEARVAEEATKAAELERANAVAAEEKRLADEKAAAELAAETERQNAVKRAEDEKLEAQRVAKEAADKAAAAELERVNAAQRQVGATHFHTLGTAQQRQASDLITTKPLVDDRTRGRSKGKNLFGSHSRN